MPMCDINGLKDQKSILITNIAPKLIPACEISHQSTILKFHLNFNLMWIRSIEMILMFGR
jgi:hypothetical protein